MMFIYIVVIVPIFLAGIFNILNMVKILEESIINTSFNNADRLKTRLSDMIATVDGIAQQIYVNEDICEFLSGGYYTPQECKDFYSSNSFFGSYINAYNQVKKMRIYVERPLPLYNDEFYRTTTSIRESKWYNEAINNKGVSKVTVFQDKTDSNVYLHLIKAIFSEDKCVGVLDIIINPDWIDSLMANETDDVVFSTERGKVFYSNIENFKIGSVIGAPDHDLLEPNLRTLTDIAFDRGDTYNVLETFEYENTNNIFQIFLITPANTINAQTSAAYNLYMWYMMSCFFLSFLIIILFTSMFSNRIDQLKHQMHSVATGDFSMSCEIEGNDEITELNEDLRRMVNSMQILIKEAYNAKLQAEQLKLSQSEAEFKALASQINPHFLYNSLETIRMKAFCSGDKETAVLVKKLGKILRRCLEVKDTNVTLGSELEFTENYLELQKARFGDRITYNIICEVEKDYLILPLIIQPIVENAFVHGVESSTVDGKIDIKITRKGSDVIITVIDNGCGMTPERLAEIEQKLIDNDTSSGKSIGLTNVNSRIKMAHGSEYGLHISSVEGKGTKVTVTLPAYSERKTSTDKEDTLNA